MVNETKKRNTLRTEVDLTVNYRIMADKHSLQSGEQVLEKLNDTKCQLKKVYARRKTDSSKIVICLLPNGRSFERLFLCLKIILTTFTLDYVMKLLKRKLMTKQRVFTLDNDTIASFLSGFKISDIYFYLFTFAT